MKRLRGMLLTAVLILVVSGASAQSGVELGVSGAYVLPSSPMAFSNYWKTRYGGGLQAGVPLSESVTLQGSLEYYSFAMDQPGVQDAFDTEYMRKIWIFDRVTLIPSADASSVIAFSANIRIAPSSTGTSVAPYFTGGLGVMQLSLSDIALPITSVMKVNSTDIAMTAQNKILGGKETALMVQSGVGLDLNVAGFLRAFVEARYALGFTKGQTTSYVPLSLGVRLRL